MSSDRQLRLNTPRDRSLGHALVTPPVGSRLRPCGQCSWRPVVPAAGGPGPGGGGPGGRWSRPRRRWSRRPVVRPPRRPPPTPAAPAHRPWVGEGVVFVPPDHPGPAGAARGSPLQGSELGSRYIAGSCAALANACSGKSVGGTLRNSHVRGHRKGHRARSTGMGHPESTRRVAWLEFSSQSRRQRGQSPLRRIGELSE